MAVELIGTDEFGRAQYKGLSSDTKPNAEVGSTFVETDTKNKYEQRATGSAGWVNTDIGGAASVGAKNTSEWAWPNTAPANYSGTAANVNDNTVVFETDDVSMYNHHEFSIVTAPGSAAVEVLVSHDGTNYETVPIQVIDRSLVVGAAVQSLAQLTAIGNYYFDGQFAKWKLQNNGATTGAACSARGSSSVK